MDREKIKLDRMRYVKDSGPSNLAILAVVFDILYFVLIYKINNEFFYNYSIGVSVVINLLFMLFGFWCSIEVKNYHGKFGYLMIALGIVQIIRIFVYPMSAHGAVTIVDGNNVQVMTNTQFISSIAFLVASAACMVFGGLLSMKNSKTLQNHLASLEK
ncbi:MAG: hypothetical protein IIY51_00485 [Erysipelotrichaceae bacterium]|jgi:hypothetical protein|nr:hypothetical protein [Erysipelotrichaceae bacterium]MBQ1300224.1 hypothetical protein [Erysipelotrichaceae bacterium]MBQ1303359.1 hypothetical protein [Erysipelotrichaceae bacterium]MBQ2213443.1 hypothetical protein [Erysipelotrichaceae bacterium]